MTRNDTCDAAYLRKDPARLRKSKDGTFYTVTQCSPPLQVALLRIRRICRRKVVAVRAGCFHEREHDAAAKDVDAGPALPCTDDKCDPGCQRTMSGGSSAQSDIRNRSAGATISVTRGCQRAPPQALISAADV